MKWVTAARRRLNERGERYLGWHGGILTVAVVMGLFSAVYAVWPWGPVTMSMPSIPMRWSETKVERCEREVNEIITYWQAHDRPELPGVRAQYMTECLQAALGR